MTATRQQSRTGLRQFLDSEQQRDRMEGKTILRDADERLESLELRFKYAARFEKLLRRPQAPEVLEILRRYGRDCIPIPRRTERHYWSVSCLPSTAGKALVRVNASWMEFFSLYADGEGIRALFVVHLSDFTTDHSRDHDQVDGAFLERCVVVPEDVRYFFPRGEDMFGVKVRHDLRPDQLRPDDRWSEGQPRRLATAFGHGGDERQDTRPRRALRRSEAVGKWPRGRYLGHTGFHGDQGHQRMGALILVASRHRCGRKPLSN